MTAKGNKIYVRHTATFSWISQVVVYEDSVEQELRAEADTLTNQEPLETSVERWANAPSHLTTDHKVTAELVDFPKLETTTVELPCPAGCGSRFALRFKPAPINTGGTPGNEGPYFIHNDSGDVLKRISAHLAEDHNVGTAP